MSRPPGRLAVLLLIAVIACFVAGCGGKDKPPVTEDLPEEVALDVATALGAMLATDKGGWMTEVKATFDHTPVFAPAGPEGFGGGPITMVRDSVFTSGGMSWNLDYTFYDGLGTPSQVFGPTTVRAVARCVATGNITITGGSTNVYVHRDSMHIDGMQDTLVTYGAITELDSAFVTVGGRHYFFDNIVEYTLDMSQRPVTAWPVGGDATIDVFLDRLRSPSRSDRSAQYDVTMTIVFDGTQTPRATIHSNVENPISNYTYEINLKTGAVLSVVTLPSTTAWPIVGAP